MRGEIPVSDGTLSVALGAASLARAGSTGRAGPCITDTARTGPTLTGASSAMRPGGGSGRRCTRVGANSSTGVKARSAGVTGKPLSGRRGCALPGVSSPRPSTKRSR